MTGRMRQIKVGCEFRYSAEIDTPAVLQVQPRSGDVTVLRQAWDLVPPAALAGYSDLYGNECQRLILPAGDSELRYEALVSVPDATEDVDLDAAETPPARLPDEVLLYTLPSRYCIPEEFADEAWQLFGPMKPGYRRVQAILDHVHNRLTFGYGSTAASTSASQAYEGGFGVCRDFAHTAITFCRALSIPARYVFGYLPDVDIPPAPEPMDFAAWIEVWLDGRWWTFDPRNNAARKGRVLVGRGRDAVDVAMVTTFGGPTLTSMTVLAEEVQ